VRAAAALQATNNTPRNKKGGREEREKTGDECM